MYIKLSASGKPDYCDLALVLIVDDSFGYPSARHIRSKHLPFLARHIRLAAGVCWMCVCIPFLLAFFNLRINVVLML